MPALLVDYENVSGSNGLKGADALCEKDTLIIFYSNCCTRIRYDHMQDIIESGCKFRVIKLKGAGKNALDFYIAAECGVMSERGEDEIAIISNDKGFQAVIDFFAMDQETLNVRIVKAENIENALTLFTNPEDKQRRKLLTGSQVRVRVIQRLTTNSVTGYSPVSVTGASRSRSYTVISAGTFRSMRANFR